MKIKIKGPVTEVEINPGYYATDYATFLVKKDSVALQTYRINKNNSDSKSKYVSIQTEPSIVSDNLPEAKKITKDEFMAELEVCFEMIREATK